MYLDNNATTPLDPRVKAAMDAVLGLPLNPSSVHARGREARAHVDAARKTIAEHLGISPAHFTFTSGGTESLHTLLCGFAPKKVITTAIEHSAALAPLKETTLLPVGQCGTPDLEALERAEGDLILLSAVNSETGALLDMDAVAAIAERRGIPLILDGVALLGKERFTIPDGVTAMAFSAHKCHGPQGVGGHFCRKKLPPLFGGGAQERGRRAGTENVAGIVGFAKAVECFGDPEEIRALRDEFERLVDAEVNGDGPRVSNTSNLYFPGVSGESLLIALDLDGVMASQGSACSAGALEPSRVLLGMGYSKERALSSLRFSFSRMNTRAEVEEAAHRIERIVTRLPRKMPASSMTSS